MKRWKRQTRLGIIAVASFVLLVTVLPQLASGFGLGALANRLESVTSGCSSSGSSGGAVAVTPVTTSGTNISPGGSGGASPGPAVTPTTVGSSSSGSSSQCPPPPPGTVTGTVTVTGAPAGFAPPYEGIGLCPTADIIGKGCSAPNDALASNGVYTLALTPGSYSITGFYELNPYGGAFLGTGRTITITSGKTITANFTVPYKAPSEITGTVAVTGLPAGTTVDQLSVLLCPSYDPYNGTTPGLGCVNGYAGSVPGATSATYEVSGLPPVEWTVYPSYCTQFGCETNAPDGKAVTLVAGKTSTVNVTSSYIVPDEGILSATITLTGAPKGTTDTVAYQACPVGGGTTGCQTYYAPEGIAYGILFPKGTWNVTAYYLASPFDNGVPGPTQKVTIAGGHTTDLALSVAYQAPGTAAGSISVIGIPATVPITSYTVVACPASAPLNPDSSSLECASEYSGPGGYGYGAADRNEKSASANANANASASASANAAASLPPAGFAGPAVAPYNVYKVTTLTPGKWLLYPGYQTELGSYMESKGTPVNVVAGRTVMQNLLVTYQKPTVGAVVGTVVVIDAPANGFEAGVQACTAIPTSTSCPGEEEGFAQQGGTYQLVLQPGTWWVSGFVYEYGAQSQSQVETAPRKVTLVAGASVTENFVVVGS